MRAGEILAGRYRVERELGAGGFGVVYLATQLGVDKEVAIKLLRLDSPEARSRFRREVGLARRLEHPHTVRLLDSGEDDRGRPFIVWERLRGQTLADVLADRGAFPEELARRIAVQILKSLFEAHALGVVHRDLKPANIFLTSPPGETYFVKVLDFGIAKDVFAGGKTIAPIPGATKFQTRASQVIGTPRYMAPEQVHGDAVGPETDLYAVGLLLSEMLTGKQVFPGNDVLELITAQGSGARAPIPIEVARSSLGPVVARATEKDRSQRYQTAAAMIADLEAPVPATARSTSRRPWLIVGGAIAATAVGAVTAIAILGGPTSSTKRVRASATASASSATLAAPARSAPAPKSSVASKVVAKPAAEDKPVGSIDWSSRTVPAYTAKELRDAIAAGGYEVQDTSPVKTHPDAWSISMFARKGECSGSAVLHYTASEEIAVQVFESWAANPRLRAVRTGSRILAVDMSRTPNVSEPDPACRDALAAVLTR